MNPDSFLIKIQQLLKDSGLTLLAFVKVLMLSHKKPGIRFKKREAEAVLLLNGPSLSTLIGDYTGFLKNKDLFCVNFFPLSPLFEEVKPTYLVIAAPELWLEDVDPVYIEKSRSLFSAVAQKTNWPLKLLIPFAAKKKQVWRSYLGDNENIEILYFNDTGIEGLRNIIFWFFRHRLAMPRPHNVLVPSLINAINLGYRTIYLWGAENNQFLDLTVDDNNSALIHQKHFYDRATSRPATMNKRGRGQRKVHEILHKFMLSFAAYHVIEDYARRQGSRIINQTPGSMIDAFERNSPD